MGSASVFVSHSKEDKKEIEFFTNIAARAGFRVYLMEWEDLEGKYSSERIRDIIKSNWIENVPRYDTILSEFSSHAGPYHFTLELSFRIY